MRDIYSKLTDQIIAKLEAGVQPWFQPWQADSTQPISRPLRVNGKPYHGINVIKLWMAAEQEGYSNPYWMTYRQALTLGGHVRKGEHGTEVVFANRVLLNEGTSDEQIVPILRTYTVFNCQQIEQLPEKYYPKPVEPTKRSPRARSLAADMFFGHLDMDLRHGGDKAYWSPTYDYVQMPNFGDFVTAADYYCTLGHEATHWTKPEARCDRDVGKVQRWGDEAYAIEELVAELGSAYIAADLGITAKPRADHASYIANWLTVLKDDKRAIFTAASYAEKALHFMQERQPGYVAEAEAEPEVVKPATKPKAKQKGRKRANGVAQKAPSDVRRQIKEEALAKIAALGGVQKLTDEGWTWERMASHAGIPPATLMKWLIKPPPSPDSEATLGR